MTGRILQVNFKFNVTREEYEQAARSLAPEFARVPGLRWKVWTLNESQNEAGGVYYFEDDASLQNYLKGPLAATVTEHPALTSMSVKQFDVMSDVTEVTRGPVALESSVP